MYSMKTSFKRDFNLLVLVREMISSICFPVLVFHCVSVDNTKISGMVCLHWEQYPHWTMEVSVLPWLHELILVPHGCLVLAIVSGMECGTADGLQKCPVRDPRMVVVVRCPVKLSVCSSNTAAPAEHSFLRLKLVRLQLRERKDFCFWHLFWLRTLSIVHYWLYRSQIMLAP